MGLVNFASITDRPKIAWRGAKSWLCFLEAYRTLLL